MTWVLIYNIEQMALSADMDYSTVHLHFVFHSKNAECDEGPAGAFRVFSAENSSG